MDSEDSRMTGCCFTGHRNIPTGAYQTIARNLGRLTETLCRIGITDYYVGGALGFDMIAAVTILNMKRCFPQIRLILALPCRSHTAHWSDIEREQFQRVLARADEVIYVSESYSRACMQLRNRYMVDHSRMCICYYRGQPGGTRNTLLYAKKQGLSVYNLYTGTESERL